MDKVLKGLVAVVGLVLVVAAVVVLHPVAVAVLTHWVWTGVFGSLLTLVKVVAVLVVGGVGVALVRASR